MALEQEAKVRITLDIKRAEDQLKDIDNLTKSSIEKADTQKKDVETTSSKIENQGNLVERMRQQLQTISSQTDNVISKWRTTKAALLSPTETIERIPILGDVVKGIQATAEITGDTFSAIFAAKERAKRAGLTSLAQAEEAELRAIKPLLDKANAFLAGREAVNATWAQGLEYMQGLAFLGTSSSAKGSDLLMEALWSSNMKMSLFRRNVDQSIKNHMALGFSDFIMKKVEGLLHK